MKANMTIKSVHQYDQKKAIVSISWRNVSKSGEKSFLMPHLKYYLKY